MTIFDVSNGSLVATDLDDLSRIVTEDDEPVDDVFSEKQQRLLTYPLLECWSGPPQVDGKPVPFLVMANVGLFFARGVPPLVPDALLSVGVAQQSPGSGVSFRSRRGIFVPA